MTTNDAESQPDVHGNQFSEEVCAPRERLDVDVACVATCFPEPKPRKVGSLISTGMAQKS